ncbi:hypothetical protein [Streptomyces sp. ME19-01-6]|uniref:hypothetical protein n=1 Tax=Streptomyces sp. ME19-01-6 TaxID=3028686 RepID=UPI0029BDBE4E|nr:hypothetical protein [Streptomyces sp. ME19-01-6]MDX3232931.1 hypothetical protein [Streptomyces sp. ME19-01-6]
MQQTRPIATGRPAPAAPIPLWERQHLFVEPVYADDQPAAATDCEDDDLERPAA